MTTPDPLEPGHITGQNPNTPERVHMHTRYYDNETPAADDKPATRGMSFFGNALLAGSAAVLTFLFLATFG
jgi:hypothetical protein